MEKCKQLEESNKLLTQSNQQLSQQMMSIDLRLQLSFKCNRRLVRDLSHHLLITHNMMRKRVRKKKRKRKRKRKMMIFILVIELVAIFLQLVTLLLGCLWSISLAACFPARLCLFHSPPLGAYLVFLPFGACFSLFYKHITSFSITGNFWFVWICGLWYVQTLFGTCGL